MLLISTVSGWLVYNLIYTPYHLQFSQTARTSRFINNSSNAISKLDNEKNVYGNKNPFTTRQSLF